MRKLKPRYDPFVETEDMKGNFQILHTFVQMAMQLTLAIFKRHVNRVLTGTGETNVSTSHNALV